MSRSLASPGLRHRRQRERRVLVLQGAGITWTLWRDGRRVDLLRERLDDARTTPPRCPWPADGETLIDVVADSPLDGIDRVLAPTLASGGALAGWRRALLYLRLRRARRRAMVRMAPPRLAPLAACLLHAELPEEWIAWLVALQEEAVTVRALYSAIRLRAAAGIPEEHRVASAPTSATATSTTAADVARDDGNEDAAPGEGDVLEITRGGGTLRHLLWRSGCPTFTRSVATGTVVVEGGPAERAALEETVAHLVERHGIVRARLRVVDRDVAGADEDALRLAALALVAPGRQGRVIPSASALLAKQRWRGERLKLHAITALTLGIALGTVLHAAVRGIESARDRARSLASAEVLAARVERLDGALDALHPEPARAAALLAHTEVDPGWRAADAIDALRFVAGVLSVHRAVRLERLSWSAEGTAPAAGRPLPDGALIELAGRIGEPEVIAAGDADPGTAAAVAGLDLRGRQRGFEVFVDDLRARAGVTALEVALSPAAAAARGSDAPPEDYVLGLRYRTRSP